MFRVFSRFTWIGRVHFCVSRTESTFTAQTTMLCLSERGESPSPLSTTTPKLNGTYVRFCGHKSGALSRMSATTRLHTQTHPSADLRRFEFGISAAFGNQILQ